MQHEDTGSIPGRTTTDRAHILVGKQRNRCLQGPPSPSGRERAANVAQRTEEGGASEQKRKTARDEACLDKT